MSQGVQGAALCLVLILSCDPQADSGYLGESLVSFSGQVVSNGGLPQLEAAMLWQRGPPPSSSDQELATRAPVQAGFPATFTVHLYHPPPSAARKTLAPGEVRWARANAAAVPYGIAASQLAGGGVATASSADGGAVPASGGMPDAGAGSDGGTPAAPPTPPPGNYGIDPSHWVVYLESDVPAGSLTEWWLGGALTTGFHLLRVTAVNPSCISSDEIDACVA
ncbi:MAG: hypothetical protein ABR567_15085, partial [Myxococcales bacterium]